MANPTEVELLREATQLQMQCSDYLNETQKMQSERWGLLRRVIEDAGKQYTQMRIDAVEERLTDEAVPLWFSVLLIVGLTVVPYHVVTTGLFTALTTSLQKAFRRSDRALLKSTEEVLVWRNLETAGTLETAMAQ